MSEFKIKVTPSVFVDSGEIHLKVQTEADKLYTEVMKTKDKATRASLIALGWTPPELKKFVFDVWEERDSPEDDVLVNHYELLAESHEIAYRIVGHMENVGTGWYYILNRVEEI